MTESTHRFRRSVPDIGELCIRPFCVDAHAGLAQRWLASDHARFWGMQHLSAAEVADYFGRIERSTTHDAFIGLCNGQPTFVVETYAPSAEPIGQVIEPVDGDCGLHILIAPPESPVHGFTWAVFALTVDFLFSDPAIQRIVVEPDVANAGIHVLNARAGFVYHREVELPGKTAWLATCTRADHDRACAALDGIEARVAGRGGVTA